MSCYCDGNDPGCQICHPNMLPEARVDLRALQRAQLNLLVTAAKDQRIEADVLRAADAYREAARRANRWDAFGAALKSEERGSA